MEKETAIICPSPSLGAI